MLGKPAAIRYGAVTLNTLAYASGAIVIAPVTFWQLAHFPLETVPSSAWMAVIYMALVPSVVCYIIYYHALTRMEASRLAAFNYLLPVLATISGVFLLDEHITVWTVVAAGVIFTGIYMVERAR